MVEVAFETAKIRRICESEPVAVELYGLHNAQKLQDRLADIRAAKFVSLIPVGKPRQIDGSEPGKFSVSFSTTGKILFCCNHVNQPLNKSGRVDWSKVNRIKIFKIEGGNES